VVRGVNRGVLAPVRELSAQVPEARSRGYEPGRFSFNVKGGRCETCQGDGVIQVDMRFRRDVYSRARGALRTCGLE
jgi:excinuclease ABC subunit A